MANWWDDPDLKTVDAKPQPQSQSLWDSFKQNVLEPAVHGAAVVGEGALHAVPDTVGFLGDLALDAPSVITPGIANPNLAIPGLGPASKKVNESFTKSEQDYTKGNVPTPKNKAEQYANVISRGIADTMVGGPEVSGRALISGATGAAAAQGTYDLTGNEDLAALAALAGGIGPHVIEKGVRSAKTGYMIRQGMQHPDWQAVNDVIVSDLEGGGTLSNPKVSKKGAMGPQQVMPETARDPGFGIRPWDGKTQADLARVGRQYSAAMMSKYNGDPAKVFAAYNAGPGKVDALIKEHGADWYDHLPKETRNYVYNGMKELGGHNITRMADKEPYVTYDEATRDLHNYNDNLNSKSEIPEELDGDSVGDYTGPDGEPYTLHQVNDTDFLMKDKEGNVVDGFAAAGLDDEDLHNHIAFRGYDPVPKSDVVPFPGDRIVNPDKVGPSSEVPFRMTKESGVPNLDDARAARYQRMADENKRKLDENDDKYISNLQHQADNAKFIIEEHLAGRPVLSGGEMGSLLKSWSDLHESMKKSKLPALGKGIVDDVIKSLENFIEKNKEIEDPKDILLNKDSTPVVRKQEVNPLNPVKKVPKGKAANEPTLREKITQAFKDMLNDDSGSLKGDNDNFHDIADARQKKELKEFHKNFMGKVHDRIKLAQELTAKAKEAGLFSFKVGDRFSTIHSRKNNLPPWKVIGHFVDPKDPEKYGYWVERGVEGKDGFERSQMPISDPNGDAKRAERGYPINREAEVSGWKKQGIVRRLLDDDSGSLNGDDVPEDAKGQSGTDHTAIDKLREALRQAKPIRDVQESMYSRARSKRMEEASNVGKKTSGEEGLYAELGALKGALPKANYESIRGHFTQEDLDGLFNVVKESQRLSYYDSVRARTALAKMLGDRDSNYATVPTDSEIQLLSKVFPKELMAELLRKRPLKDRVLHNIVSGLNVPRALMASMDLSAPFRQGVFLVGTRHFWKSFGAMFKAFGSEKAFQAAQDEIISRPTYRLMRKARLALSGADHVLADREEAFMSDLAEKIPVAGGLVRRSTRAYEAFLNKLRADTFDSLVKQSKEAGIDLDENHKALRDIARFINAATGRGDLGKLNQAAPLLNAAFFSPRLMASRVQMLTDPRIYVTSSPVVRKAAIKSLLSFSGIAMTVLSLAAAGGASVSLDPTDTDFGKIKIGDTRYDILGGFQQYIRLGARLIMGKSTSNGKTTSLTSGKYGSRTRASELADFARSKEAPVVSFVHDLLNYPKDKAGNKLDVPKEVENMFIPLVIQDTIDAVKEYGTKGLISGVPGIFGVGVQTYKPKAPKTKEKKNWWEDFAPTGNSSSKKKEWWETV